MDEEADKEIDRLRDIIDRQGNEIDRLNKLVFHMNKDVQGLRIHGAIALQWWNLCTSLNLSLVKTEQGLKIAPGKRAEYVDAIGKIHSAVQRDRELRDKALAEGGEPGNPFELSQG